MLQKLFVIIAASLGFLLANHIRLKKVRKEQLVCFLGASCNEVIHSKFSETLGVKNELIGMVYYAGVTLYCAAALIYPGQLFIMLHPIFLIIVGGASAFSLYLIYVQTFVLKKWCEWCLASTALSLIISLVIFFLVL